MLAAVKRATLKRARADEAWKDAIRAAVAEGHSTRAVGEAAGVTHARVVQLTKAP